MPNPSTAQYDEVPFPSLPTPGSQIENLATLARLRGLCDGKLAHARVLELGCAGGQNLLPMAERHASAQFMGIDFSARQIESATAAARELGLSNIQFRQLDISQLPDDLGTFDYVIAHAVYSWVDAPVRDELLAACRKHLAPRGLAYISYNVYPGWHVHDILRAAMLYDSRYARSTPERLAAARASLKFLNDSLDPALPYDSVVLAQIAQLMKQSDAYLLHDHLEPVNYPVYYREFAAHARRHGLRPAGDCVLGIRFVDFLGAEIEQRLDATTTDADIKEEYRDIVRNRSIRQTLVCHQDVDVASSLRSDQLEGMHLAAHFRPENSDFDPRSGRVDSFVTLGGVRVSTQAPLIKSALMQLTAAWPAYVPIAQLTEAAFAQIKEESSIESAPPAEVARLKDNLLQCCAGGAIELHSQPHPFCVTVSAQPAASPLVRWQARQGSLVTNRKHQAIQIGPFERQTLELLDGTRNLEQIAGQLYESSARGRLQIIDRDQPLGDATMVREAIDTALPDALASLANNAFLIG